MTIVIPITAIDTEQSGAALAAEILESSIAKPGRAIYVPSKEELDEIEALRKDSAISSPKSAELTCNHKIKKDIKKAKEKLIQKNMHQLENAAASGKQALVEFLLNKKLKYSQDRALQFAAMNDQRSLVKFLLKYPIQLKYSQSGINTAIKSAAFYGKKNMVEFLLNWQEQPQPDAEVINWALRSAAGNNQIATVEFLLSRPDGKFKLSQDVINISTIDAARSGNQTIIKLLLNRPKGQLIPNQDGIIYAYREALAHNYIQIIRLLMPHVPPEERQYQIEPNKGLAYEIHNYTDTEVTNNKSSFSSIGTKPTKLIDAVWDNINIKLKEVTIMGYNDAKSIIEQAIEQFIPKDQQALAKQAALYRLGGDDYEDQLSIAVTFIQIFHEDKMEQWIDGFVRESIEAYRNSSNPASCSKGIRERIATGFRGIDPELDSIYAPAEGALLVRNWLKTWDLLNVNNETKQCLAKQLKTKGINEKSSAADAANAFRVIANEELQKQGMAGNKDSKTEIETYADYMVEENYDTILKPFIDAKLTKTSI